LSSPSIVNNTISNNEAEDEGGGVLCWNNSSPIIRNNIVWGNVAPIDSSIRLCCGSSPVVSYSNVQGGWDGVGNRNTDPLFADSTHFHLSSASPCIDAGNPSPNFNDPEDPLNPGFALFPAMGTLRNDMGTYGGPGTTGQLPVDVREPERETHLPVSFVLCQNYPNPFNPSTMIQFSLPQAEFVTLKVFNMLGQEITTLVSKDLSAGTYKTEWNAQALPSGIYFYRLQTGTFCQTRKLVLLR
jgi:parallel beta-helix repeat protein